MSLLSLVSLFLIYSGYLIIGGVIFHTTECPQEEEDRRQESFLTDALLKIKKKLDGPDSKTLEKIIKLYISTEFQNGSKNKTTDCQNWDYVNSVFFSFTVVTTIGYGHLYPETPEGKAACLVYALIGIPLNALLVGSLGNLFGNKLKRIMLHFDSKRVLEDPSHSKDRTILLAMETIGFSLLFTSFLLLVPSAIFMLLEDWNFLDSFYYTLITLTTVGFGDMVPDKDTNDHIDTAALRWIYLIGTILWILLGMGYILAVIEVISDTYRSSSGTVKKVLEGCKNTIALTEQVPEPSSFENNY